MIPRDDEIAENDPELRRLGYAGDAIIYRPRLARINQLRHAGRGPGAYLDRFLNACAYKSPWRPATTK
jgi:hypothetical protein